MAGRLVFASVIAPMIMMVNTKFSETVVCPTVLPLAKIHQLRREKSRLSRWSVSAYQRPGKRPWKVTLQQKVDRADLLQYERRSDQSTVTYDDMQLAWRCGMKAILRRNTVFNSTNNSKKGRLQKKHLI